MPHFRRERGAELAAAMLVLGIMPGCGDDTGATSSMAGGAGGAGGSGGGGAPSCTDGETLDASHGECVVQAAVSCPPGERPVIGTESCEPTGWTACSGSFRLHASGWGCENLAPYPRCEGATRVDLETGECVPLGECRSAPPRDAAFFVDDSYPVEALDDQHFLSIGEALIASAGSGATIYVESGTYIEALNPPAGAYTIVGRCAAEVLIESDGGLDAGLSTGPGDDIVLRGVTLKGHRGGIVSVGGTLLAEDVAIVGNRDLGVAAFVASSDVTIRRSKIADTLATNGILGRGINAEAGIVRIEASELARNREVGVFVQAAELTMRNALVRDTQLDGSGAGGRGVYLRQAAKAAIEGSVLAGNHEVGLFAVGNSEATVSETVIRDTQPIVSGGLGRGIVIGEGSQLALERASLIGNHDTGLSLEDGGSATVQQLSVLGTRGDGLGNFGAAVFLKEGSTLELADAALVDNREFTVAVLDSSINVRRAAIASTNPGLRDRYGFGMAIVESAATIEDTALWDHRGAAIFATGTTTSVKIATALMRGTGIDPSFGAGHGLLCVDGNAIVTDSLIEENASVGAFFHGATSGLHRSYVVNNTIGLAVQGASQLVEGAAEAEPSPLQVLVGSDTTFAGNEQQLSSQVLPLPELPLLE